MGSTLDKWVESSKRSHVDLPLAGALDLVEEDREDKVDGPSAYVGGIFAECFLSNVLDRRCHVDFEKGVVDTRVDQDGLKGPDGTSLGRNQDTPQSHG